MTIYIIKEKNELLIVAVQPGQEVNFLKEYEGQILVTAPTVREALRLFHALPMIYRTYT